MDIVGLFFVLAAFAGILTIQSRISRTDQRVARVEHKLDLILDHLGLRADDPRMDEVLALLRNDKKIQAIKVYREITGAGLKEAKDAVERMV
ncbi:MULTISPECIES: ribosomal protein L7/L12 [unclassified Streptomyces]|uniref:ribosomal protein L7/L12 n=1 Tax=unclassified Streptomyces TaxID=2593676 RepID=UPI0023669BFC|nr:MULTISPECIES: ribosomal protein L7/L12 [unclassified Streptomyces]MDF3146116.1 ribosomal protein L7/L12 [Streptomyces sp. T21Q-yed]WDF39756.1 ribosomal protein L7/L12 [Streptomyces sp. T12]